MISYKLSLTDLQLKYRLYILVLLVWVGLHVERVKRNMKISDILATHVKCCFQLGIEDKITQ